MIMSDLTCFKAYDIRGEIGLNFNEDIVYLIGRAKAHLNAKIVVIDLMRAKLVLRLLRQRHEARWTRAQTCWTLVWLEPKKCIGLSLNLVPARGLKLQLFNPINFNGTRLLSHSLSRWMMRVIFR